MILDNHDSHLSISALDYAKENGIVVLTIPPHCSHKVQPLDCSVFGPFRRYYSTAIKSWIVDNPGKPMSIFNILEMVAKAFPKAMTIENITGGFRATGIFPFDPNVHKPSDFVPSMVTDRPDPTTSNHTLATVTTTSHASTVEPSVVLAQVSIIWRPDNIFVCSLCHSFHLKLVLNDNRLCLRLSCVNY